MRIPYRKPGKFSQLPSDPMMTENKFDELTHKLKHLKEVRRPQAATEVAQLAELGDFSENTEYQLAKGRLRGINNTILKLEQQLANASIINHRAADTVQLGSAVTVECGGKHRTFQILGSAETDPKKGIISHRSPLGAALLGRDLGDVIIVKRAGVDTTYRIIKIE